MDFKVLSGVSEMAQQVKVFTAKTEDPSSVLWTHMVEGGKLLLPVVL